jgi:hypothetical protein
MKYRAYGNWKVHEKWNTQGQSIESLWHPVISSIYPKRPCRTYIYASWENSSNFLLSLLVKKEINDSLPSITLSGLITRRILKFSSTNRELRRTSWRPIGERSSLLTPALDARGRSGSVPCYLNPGKVPPFKLWLFLRKIHTRELCFAFISLLD